MTRLQPGGEVLGIGKGTYAEYACAPESKLVPKPAGLTFAQAAVVAISGSTALQALRDHGRVQPGQTVLVIGASGGVGTYAVQLAVAFGAHVTGVCSTCSCSPRSSRPGRDAPDLGPLPRTGGRPGGSSRTRPHVASHLSHVRRAARRRAPHPHSRTRIALGVAMIGAPAFGKRFAGSSLALGGSASWRRPTA